MSDQVFWGAQKAASICGYESRVKNDGINFHRIDQWRRKDIHQNGGHAHLSTALMRTGIRNGLVGARATFHLRGGLGMDRIGGVAIALFNLGMPRVIALCRMSHR